MNEIWINSLNGDDFKGDGSREKPFRTTDRAMTQRHCLVGPVRLLFDGMIDSKNFKILEAEAEIDNG